MLKRTVTYTKDNYSNPPTTVTREEWTYVGYAFLAVCGLLVGAVLLFGFATASKSFNRYQKRADANNNVRVSEIQIKNQAQRVQIAIQKAAIRKQDAIGIRNAQDEISKTLTPLYVQFEMGRAIEAIATSGKNNSVIYIPVGANGVPLISNTNPNEVTLPNGNK